LVEHVRVPALVEPPPTNAAIADLPRVEVAWRNLGELVREVMSSLVKPLFRWYCTVRG